MFILPLRNYDCFCCWMASVVFLKRSQYSVWWLKICLICESCTGLHTFALCLVFWCFVVKTDKMTLLYAVTLFKSIFTVCCVSLELVRLCHSQHITSDMYMTAMSCDGTVAAKPRTVALSEELGQIRFILSDKTGTLTQVLYAYFLHSYDTAWCAKIVWFLIAFVTHLENVATIRCVF